MRFEPGNAQHIGTRKEQQDEFGFSALDDPEFVAHAGCLAVLADGMGGMANGAEASHVAVRVFLDQYRAKSASEPVADALRRAFEEANRAVFAAAEKCGLEGKMGTTLVAAVLRPGGIEWISAGDSRLYLIRNHRLFQVSRDHDLGAELDAAVDRGELAADEGRDHPDRGALTSFLGLPQVPKTDRSKHPAELLPGDRVLLCSDGLYRALSDEEIVAELGGSAAQAAERLVSAAVGKGLQSMDNTTVMVFVCEDAPAGKTAGALSRSPSAGELLRPLLTRDMPRLAVGLALCAGFVIGFGLGTLGDAPGPAAVPPAPTGLIVGPRRPPSAEPETESEGGGESGAGGRSSDAPKESPPAKSGSSESQTGPIVTPFRSVPVRAVGESATRFASDPASAPVPWRRR